MLNKDLLEPFAGSQLLKRNPSSLNLRRNRLWMVCTLLLLLVGSPNRLFHHFIGALLGLAPLFYGVDGRPWRQQIKTAGGIWFLFCLFVFWTDFFSVKVLSWAEIVGGIVVAPLLPLFYIAATLLSLNLTRALPPFLRPLGIASVWTALDGILNLIWFPIPFHWGSLLYDWTVGIQIADVTGIWGVTFVSVLINATLMGVGQQWWQSRSLHRPNPNLWGCLGIGLVVSGWVIGYGLIRLPAYQNLTQDSYQVAAVQMVGWLEPDRRWQYREQRYLELQGLSRLGIARGAQLVVWPEGALRARFLNTTLQPYILDPLFEVLPPEGGLILGATEPDPKTQDLPDEQVKFINAALLFRQQGNFLDQYGKQWIFPYFETARYVPSAEGYRPLNGGSTLGQLGVMICLESVLPSPSRRLVQRGAESLIVISDDSWFGNSNWPKLHGNLSIFRAIENRRSITFVNNTGGNLIVDPSGEIQAAGTIFEQDVVVGQVFLGQEITFYTQLGDWFSYLCITILLGLVGSRWSHFYQTRLSHRSN
ncbi:MAG: apolipoprotein N-acyltransferase [Cyanobacteriota bacterium]|nr:apolipoprotein N-acyltransferase [Cyanobacteriota bacterium]